MNSLESQSVIPKISCAAVYSMSAFIELRKLSNMTGRASVHFETITLEIETFNYQGNRSTNLFVCG